MARRTAPRVVLLCVAVLALCTPRTGATCVSNFNHTKWPTYSSRTVLNDSPGAGAQATCANPLNDVCAQTNAYPYGSDKITGSCANWVSMCKALWNNGQPVNNAQWAYSGSGGGLAAANPPKPDPTGGTHDHILVQPVAPCRGVEEHWTDFCGRESIWNAAWYNVINHKSLTAGEKLAMQRSKGLGINCPGRRTQHQMHVHVADVNKGLANWLGSLVVDTDTYFSADCVGVASLTCTPKPPGTQLPGGRTLLYARCLSVNKDHGPSEVMPFKNIYGTYFGFRVYGGSCASSLVYSPKPNVFCTVLTTDRPVECLIDCKSSCVGHVSSSCK